MDVLKGVGVGARVKSMTDYITRRTETRDAFSEVVLQ